MATRQDRRAGPVPRPDLEGDIEGQRSATETAWSIRGVPVTRVRCAKLFGAWFTGRGYAVSGPPVRARYDAPGFSLMAARGATPGST
jgi:hypothetical protein